MTKPRSDPAAVLATWTAKSGPEKGLVAYKQEWTYTQADYEADQAMQGDPGGDAPTDIVTPMTPPHNTFTRRQWDAFYWAFMRPSPGSCNWSMVEFVWTGAV